jgi:tetratricopeptide (TPR) repeat protein
MDDRAGAALPGDHPARLLALAKRAHAAGEYGAAAEGYRRALERGGPRWARRSDALAGLLLALYRGRDVAACADAGARHVSEVEGAALPADFASVLLACAAALPDGDARRSARAAAIARLRALTQKPPPDASADDRADAFGILADGLSAEGDAAGARAANESKLAVLERAAREAPTPEAASAYDYGRAMAYLALSRGDAAVALLTEREAQMPSSYEPPARLAQVLHATGRDREALAAIDRAVARAYGPRRLRYLKLRAEIQGALGDLPAAVATLREEIQGHEALAGGHATPQAIEDARRRLAEAESALAGAQRSSPRATPKR